MFSLRSRLLVVLLAVATRLVAAWLLESHVPAGSRFEFGDSDTYWDLARRVAAGKSYEYAGMRVFRAPGYPLFLAAGLRVIGPDADPFWGRAASALLGGATVAAVMFWGRVAFSPRAGFWAGLATAIYPGAAALGGVVLSEALFMPLVALQLALWTLAWRAQREPLVPGARRAGDLGWSAAAGAVAGLATLTRPSWLLFTPLALAVELVWGLRSGRDAWPAWPRRLAGTMILLASFAAVMAPWWIRNALVTGHFVPTTLQVGASLYDGLNPAANGGSNMAFLPAFTAALEREEWLDPAARSESFEYRLDARLRQEAWRWAAEHQGRAVQLALVKLARVWNIWPNEPAFRSWPLRLVVLGSYVPVAVAGVVGAWRLRGAGWAAALGWLPAVYLSMLHMIFVGSIRYREPAMLGLIVLAAAALARGNPEQKA